MENNKITEFKKILDRFQKVRKELFEEWKLKFPSHSILERSASEIMQILKVTKSENEEFEFWKSWKIREMDIFIADLAGQLHHDYDKRLKRYHGKWTEEKGKLDNLIFEFQQKFGNQTE
jgi:hypothetical protein